MNSGTESCSASSTTWRCFTTRWPVARTRRDTPFSRSPSSAALDGRLVVRDDRIAVRALVARVDQRVHRQRVVVGRRDRLLHEAPEDARLLGGQLDHPSTSSAIVRSWSVAPDTSIVVTADSRHISRSSRIFSCGPIERDVLDEPGRHRGRRLRLLAVEVEVLDQLGFALVAHAPEHVVVEVDLARAHAADVEREHGPVHVGRGLDVVGDDHRDDARDLERVGGAARARAGEALGQRVAVEVVVAGRVEHRQPAVGDLGRERDVLRALGREVDREVGAQRVRDRLERLAEPGAARAAAAGSARRRTRPAPRAPAPGARSRRTRACAPAACGSRRRTNPRRPAGPTRRDRA